MKNKMIVLLLLTVLFSLFICSCGKDEISDPVIPNNSGDTQNEDPQKDPQSEDPKSEDPKSEDQPKTTVDLYEQFKHVYYVKLPERDGIIWYNPYKPRVQVVEMDLAENGKYLEYENDIVFSIDSIGKSFKIVATERNKKEFLLLTYEPNGDLYTYLSETYGLLLAIYFFNSEGELFTGYQLEDLGDGMYNYVFRQYMTKNDTFNERKEMLIEALGSDYKEGQGYMCAYLAPARTFTELYPENERTTLEEIYESWGEEITKKIENGELI